MDVRNRRRELLETLQGRGKVQVRDLAGLLRCSEMTVRRDLDALERDGVVRRVHGGAVEVQLRQDEVPYGARQLQAVEAKAAIGKAAADLISDGETVVLDGGTTGLEVARALKGRPVTILPLGLRALVELVDDPSVQVIAPGGEVRAGELVFGGELAEVAFERLRFDTFVLGCCGLDSSDGVTTHVPADARVKRAAVSASRRTIAVADRSKLDKVAFARVCPIEALECLVTDADDSDVKALDVRAVHVL